MEVTLNSLMTHIFSYQNLTAYHSVGWKQGNLKMGCW